MSQSTASQASSHKSRTTASLLALFLGVLGIHQFYLGNKISGTVRIVLTVTFYGALISLPLALVEFVMYVTVSDERFHEIYVVNKKAWPWQRPSSRHTATSRDTDAPSNAASIGSRRNRNEVVTQSGSILGHEGYDLAILGEPIIRTANVSSGLRSGMIALTQTRLVYLRKEGNETFVDRESQLNAVTGVTFKKALGTWQLTFNDGKRVAYDQQNDELEPFVEPLRAAIDAKRESDREERLSSTICNARGKNGQVHLFEDRVLITRQGFVSAIFYGFRGEKEILISEITSIGWKEPGLMPGYIHFEYVGGQAPVRTGLFADDSIGDNENAVLFTEDHQIDFEEFRKLLEEKRTELRKPQQVVATAVASPMEELKKLAELKESGVVTEEEFEAKKNQLLGT